jgi:hypothetical protein
VRITDHVSGLSVNFALQSTSDSEIEIADDVAVYAGALRGADLLHRVHARGTEDFVAFEEKPEHEELEYLVDVSRVAGLRFLGGALELLDEAGAPRLRVNRPYVIDARGAKRDATLELEGCSYDESPAAPWGRPVTSPGSRRCIVRVRWDSVEYPALVDPAWETTGSMAEPRAYHTATMLESGLVLVAGGFNECGISCNELTSAELCDPETGTFAATGSMPSGHALHAAALLADGRVLITGSNPPGGKGGPVLSNEATTYDPVTGQFTAIAPMVEYRGRHTATLLPSGGVLITGGARFDPETTELWDGTAFTPGPVMPVFRLRGSCRLLAADWPMTRSENCWCSSKGGAA